MGYDQTNFGMAAAVVLGDNEGDGEKDEDEGGLDGDEEVDIDNKDRW